MYVIRTDDGQMVGTYETDVSMAIALAKMAEERNTLLAEREAMQNQTQTLTCIYCGHQYPPGTPPSNHIALTEHIRICPKHPLRAAILALGNLTDAVVADVDMRTASPRLRVAMDAARRIAGANI